MKSIAKKHSAREVEVVQLCTGQQKSGAPYYAYVLIRASKIEALKKAQDNGSFRLQDFGRVIAWGSQETPPEEVRSAIEEHYIRPANPYLAEPKAEMVEFLKQLNNLEN